jgi:hypothetical protein
MHAALVALITLITHHAIAPSDISYARGYVTQWDNFHHQLEPIVTRMPYMVAQG